MPLVKCIDCGKMVSNRAQACPNCGCPIDIILEEARKEKEIKAEKEH